MRINTWDCSRSWVQNCQTFDVVPLVAQELLVLRYYGRVVLLKGRPADGNAAAAKVYADCGEALRDGYRGRLANRAGTGSAGAAR